jgi:hypothetical protein
VDKISNAARQCPQCSFVMPDDQRCTAKPKVPVGHNHVEPDGSWYCHYHRRPPCSVCRVTERPLSAISGKIKFKDWVCAGCKANDGNASSERPTAGDTAPVAEVVAPTGALRAQISIIPGDKAETSSNIAPEREPTSGASSQATTADGRKASGRRYCRVGRHHVGASNMTRHPKGDIGMLCRSCAFLKCESCGCPPKAALSVPQSEKHRTLTYHRDPKDYHRPRPKPTTRPTLADTDPEKQTGPRRARPSTQTLRRRP